MFKKLSFIALATLVLGGCSLKDLAKTNTAVTDEKEVMVSASPSPAPATSDKELDTLKPVSSSTDNSSLETDINNTVILNEDFTDIK